MEFVLAGILLILMIAVGGKRGAKTFAALYINIFILIFTVFLIACGFSAITASLLGCAVIGVVVLFVINGVNIKTVTAFAAIVTVLLIMTALMLYIGSQTHIQGFADENTDEICWYSPEIGLDMTQVSLAMVLMGLIGAIVDTSIAITSALNEVYENNPHLSKKELFISGMNIGKDMIGTMSNTLILAFAGSGMTMLLSLISFGYSLRQFFSSDYLAIEMAQGICSTIGVIISVPITSAICAWLLIRQKRENE